MSNESIELINENISYRKNCNFCKESLLNVGESTDYGSIVIYKIGRSKNDAWFATLSPKTGGDQKIDFTIQLMPFAHLTHFSQISRYSKLAENYGIAFSKISAAMANIMAKDKPLKANASSRGEGISIATYGKCTTWVEKKEHLHIKFFPFRGSIGQPFTVDSSFEKKIVHEDKETGERFVKMIPVGKKAIDKERIIQLSEKMASLLRWKK